ncbi:outer membrane beta-barrel protein [bacterium]|nr:outer membrane beta-barrel protein [bacterium]
MKKYLLAVCLLVPSLAYPLEGVGVGGQFGYVGLTNSTYPGALGFGGEITFRTNPVLDIALRSQWSQHAGTPAMSIWANTISADLMIGRFNDFDVFLGGGPGFYQFAGAGTNGRFGLHGEIYSDLNVGDSLKLGLGWRFHGIFSPAGGESSFWTVMARVSFFFGIDP